MSKLCGVCYYDFFVRVLKEGRLFEIVCVCARACRSEVREHSGLEYGQQDNKLSPTSPCSKAFPKP